MYREDRVTPVVKSKPIDLRLWDQVKTTKKPINVLSLCDGMGGVWQALKNSGILFNGYASEIDPYPIKVVMDRHVEVKHVGDMTRLSAKHLPQLDLIVGGSPCQGFSRASGSATNFDDPRSKLFWEYARIVKEAMEINPGCKFLLENVKMAQFAQDIISDTLGVSPIAINSALVSAQNRQRLYWTNIPQQEQPEDEGLVLADILDDDAFATDEMTTKQNKSFALTASYEGAVYWNSIERKQRTMIGTATKRKTKPSSSALCKHVADANDLNGHESLKRVYDPSGKAPTINAMTGGNREPKITCGAWRGRYVSGNSGKTEQRLEIRDGGKTNALTTVEKDNNVVLDDMYYRKLTVTECLRLQTYPDGYCDSVSKTRAYKMIGNSFTVKVIEHLIKGFK
jgi:DNA-cytosine methyltransferase